MFKRGKEFKINGIDNYNIVYGTVDTKNPKSIYINISAWGQPKLEGDIPYNRVISQLNKSIKQLLYKKLSKLHFAHDKVLIDLDMRESGIEFGKRSFMNCEITLYQKMDLPIESEELVVEINNVVKLVLSDVFDASDFFKFYHSKT